MTYEKKELLLKDLCARLPYGVQILYDSEKKFDSGVICQPSGLTKINGETYITAYHVVDPIGLDETKHYLRPMSSMTPDEFEQFTNIVEHINIGKLQINIANPEAFDFLNAHHFDYRGLIEKDLALKALEGMY